MKAVAAILLSTLALPSIPKTEACSVCRCGDVTFNALGKAGYTVPGLRMALDWERFDKTEGDPTLEQESLIENRMTALASYGFSERVMLTARVPYSVRQTETSSASSETETVNTSGFSDPEIYGQVKLWASNMSTLGQQSSLSLVAGIKTPWGQNNIEQDAERVDEHSQPGTGSTDALGNLAFLYLLNAESAIFASGGYRYTGDNAYGYRYGNTFLANFAYERKLTRALDSVLDLNFRHAEKDRIDDAGIQDDDTGGSVLYVTPRLLLELGQGVVIRGAAQIPVMHDLNGFQEENIVASLGVTWVPKF